MDLVGALEVGDLADAFARLPVFPVFDLGYFVVSLLYLKYEKDFDDDWIESRSPAKEPMPSRGGVERSSATEASKRKRGRPLP